LGKTVGKVLGIAAMVVGAVALVATGAGLILGAAAVTAALGGISAAALMTAAGILSIGASLLSPRPKPPSVGSAALDRLQVTLDPNAPRKAIFGHTALAVDMRDQEVQEGSETSYVHRWIVCAAHKVHSIDEIWFDGERVWSSATGVIAKYAQFLTVTAITEGSPSNYINAGTRITPSTRRFTGCAYVYLRFKLTEKSPFKSSIPTKMVVRGKGMPVYDPRKDSTVSGGSGSQRADDCSTWTYDSGGNLQGENPALQMLSWLLGWYIVNPSTAAKKLSVGKGIPKDRFDMPAFITAANICDEVVALNGGGTERRYRAAGIVTEAEDMETVCDRWKAAMNADMDDVSGKIRVQIFVNDLGAPVAQFTDKDIINQFVWKPVTGLPADINVVRGRYVNPSDTSLYQLSEYPPVKLTSPDGIDRPETFDLAMVQSHSQAQRLAKMRLQRAQFPGTFQAVFQFGAHRVQKGDPVTLTFAPLGFVNQLFRVVDLLNRNDGMVPLTLRIEHASIYQWDNNEAGEVSHAPPIIYANPPIDKLISGEWTPPSATTLDANLLRDAQFGDTYWTKTALFGRIDSFDTKAGQLPINPTGSFVGEIALGSGSAQSATYDKGNLPAVIPNRLHYFRCGLQKSVSAAGTATMRLTVTFINDAGATQGSPVTVDTAIADLPAGGALKTVVVEALAPVGATRAKVACEVPANSATGTVRFDNPTFLDKEPGADVTAHVTGLNNVIVKYTYQGNPDTNELPRYLKYQLRTASGVLTQGVTWKYKVKSGIVNGFTPTSAEQTMPVSNGEGTLEIASPNGLATGTAEVEVYAIVGDKRTPYNVKLEQLLLPAPQTGGGSSGNPTTQTSGFFNHGTTSFTAVSNNLSYTTPTGKSTNRVSINLDVTPITTTNGLYQHEGKFQRESSPGSGVWNDIGAVQTTWTEVESGIPVGIGNFSYTFDDTGRTPGQEYVYRWVERVVTANRTHGNAAPSGGGISIVAP
jgi:hypothetical protein